MTMFPCPDTKPGQGASSFSETKWYMLPSTWAVELGVAVPFIVALAFIGKWLVDRLEKSEEEKKDLYQQVLNDCLTAIHASTNAMTKVNDSQEDALEFMKDLREELRTRQRAESELQERLRTQLAVNQAISERST